MSSRSSGPTPSVDGWSTASGSSPPGNPDQVQLDPAVKEPV
ncbi:hypothetical protein [Antribacter gilvus]|nr:hypothetical protein [Antribacter gilvus]